MPESAKVSFTKLTLGPSLSLCLHSAKSQYLGHQVSWASNSKSIPTHLHVHIHFYFHPSLRCTPNKASYQYINGEHPWINHLKDRVSVIVFGSIIIIGSWDHYLRFPNLRSPKSGQRSTKPCGNSHGHWRKERQPSTWLKRNRNHCKVAYWKRANFGFTLIYCGYQTCLILRNGNSMVSRDAEGP